MGYRLGEEFLVKMADAGSIGMPFLMAQQGFPDCLTRNYLKTMALRGASTDVKIVRFHFSQFDAMVYSFVPGLVGGVLLGGLVAKWCCLTDKSAMQRLQC